MSALNLVAKHILRHQNPSAQPLFVALQGPQGSGKSFLAEQLQTYLSSAPHSLRVVILSIDDLYLPHDDLVSLARSHPKNALWQGRGQPGTHDTHLGSNVLSALKEGKDVEIPRFDKSLFDGEGDRLPMDGSGTIIQQPPVVDLVILEGWCVGFHPISPEELDSKWSGIWTEERSKLGMGEQMGRKEDIQNINIKLQNYVDLWRFLDVFVQIKPATSPIQIESEYAVVYKWRLEQEQYMKSRNGGRGMSDEAVKLFVDRYIPGYVFFGDIQHVATKEEGYPPWYNRGLSIYIDDKREVIRSASF